MSESQMEFLNFDSGSPQVDVDIELWRRVSGIKLEVHCTAELRQTAIRLKISYTTPEEIHRCRIRGGTCKAGG